MIRKKLSNTVLFHAVVCAIGFVMIYPLIWMFFSSFKESSLVLSTVDHLFPEKWEFGNYLNGWSGFGGTTFTTFFQNSVIVTVVSVIGNVLASAMAAYGFTRIRFRGRGFFFICMLITMMVPSQVLVVPQYIIFNGLNWVNTFLPLTVPEWGGRAFFIFLIMQFIAGIPKDLDEAAEIDGCGKVRLFTRVMMPLIKPALATSAIFSFYWKWDDFMGSLLYLNSPEKYTVSIALKLFCDPTSVSDYGAMFAMCVASLLPVIVLFLFTQKYIVDGIAMSGLKA
ncbi:carbohydrate ABC transporter permease [Lachnotalea sp. AF33-28]|uniref:carbohydrate ABC transporter permease n=1 Tax=Lachnotalea sp. AF33-28 TaxID=2292046 RepID=UPI000E4D07A0|nr:carbohydrate ABC transporter permease [Lachnotalea sp. AF33-28]RHP32060.1 carbohydrate ABC transporter permease [Lachnotalea sp. AF33-28]